MELSKKKKAFSQYFSAFLKCRKNFEYFQKNDDAHGWCISEITDSEKRI